MPHDVGQLFRQYHAPLVRMLQRRTGDVERAREIAQETFARAVEAPPTNPRPWLFAVALNLVREDARREKTRGRRLTLLRNELPTSSPAPDHDIEREERRASVRRALAQLSERDREALLLKAEGFSYDEIATSLGMARGAIGTTLARARKKLVEAYRAQEPRTNAAS